jgi:hypothetical protein
MRQAGDKQARQLDAFELLGRRIAILNFPRDEDVQEGCSWGFLQQEESGSYRWRWRRRVAAAVLAWLLRVAGLLPPPLHRRAR